MPDVRIGDLTLHAVDQGSGMPVLLVHGFPLDHTMWREQISRLAAHYRVIAPDLRGFGRSQVVPGTSTMQQMATDLAGLLDTLEVRQPVVCCGLSMGGYVAFQFWRQWPERLRALVLCDTRAIADSPEARAGRYQLVDQLQTAGSGVLADAMLGKLFGPATRERRAELIHEYREKLRATSPEGAAAALRGMAERPDVRPYLPNIACPALVVVGQDDVISTPQEMSEIARAIPAAQLVTIPEAGHMTPLENPDVFNEALESFLAGI